MEKQQHHQTQLRLLPNYFKKIGIGLFLLAVLFVFYLRIYKKEIFEQDAHSAAALFFFDIIIVGFLLLAFAKDKIEDELLILIRLQSIAYAFIFGVLYLIITHLIGYLISNLLIDAGGQEIILTSLLVYNTIFIIKKKKLIYQ